jgi:hypothetical protein
MNSFFTHAAFFLLPDEHAALGTRQKNRSRVHLSRAPFICGVVIFRTFLAADKGLGRSGTWLLLFINPGKVVAKSAAFGEAPSRAKRPAENL